jgi:hypothetical protein
MMNAVLVAHECAAKGLAEQVATAVRPVEEGGRSEDAEGAEGA